MPPSDVYPGTLWDYVREGDDPPETADLIVGFGGHGTSQPTEAAKLYKKGLTQKILFTGHKPAHMTKEQLPEAVRFQRIAVKLGVPKKDIIIEEEARNTVENAKNSINPKLSELSA